MTNTNRCHLKGTITVLLLIIFFALALSMFIEFFTLDHGMEIKRLNKEAERLATRLYFDKMTTLAQLATALLGGLWAFLSLAKTKVKIKGCATITCFILANISLCLSLLIYAFGYNFIVERIFYHACFDIDAPIVRFVQNYQQLFFLIGSLCLIPTIIFGRETP